MADQLPPPPVLTPPAGWLGFLGIKSGGKQPAQVTPGLAPTIEMAAYYRAGLRVSLANQNIAANQNGNAFMAGVLGTVPQGKVWLLEFAVANSPVLGAVPPGVAYVTVVDTNNAIVFKGDPSIAGVTGSSFLAHLAGPLILLPGYKMGVFTAGAGAMTAFNYTLAVYGMEVAA